MREDDSPSARFAVRLLQEEARGEAASAPSSEARDGYALLERLLDHEQEKERRIRQIALWAWGVVLAVVPLGGASFYLSRVGEDGLSEAGRGGIIAFGVLAVLATFLAVLMTVTWLFGSRSVSLALIERRLAVMEERVVRREP